MLEKTQHRCWINHCMCSSTENMMATCSLYYTTYFGNADLSIRNSFNHMLINASLYTKHFISSCLNWATIL